MEIEKYSERDKSFEESRKYTTPVDREETFIRDGDAEILRLRSNDDRSPRRNKIQRQNDQFQSHPTVNSINENAAFATDPKISSANQGQSHQMETKTTENAFLKYESSGEDGRTFSIPTQRVIENASELDKFSNSAITDMLICASANKEEGQENNNRLDPGPEPTKFIPAVADDSDRMIENVLDVSQLEMERNKLTLFQRDLLLTRFLVEEQRRYLHRAGDTVSLPGSLSMATQTDRHQSTQTDALCSMRPEPRKVKSENDDSSDGEIEDQVRSGKRFLLPGGRDRRHKIRTPIIEETENADGLRSIRGLVDRESRGFSKMGNNLSNGYVEAKRTQLKLRKCISTYDMHDRRTPLTHTKKSISFSNIAEACCLLSDKEVYTPPSLKSRIAARRLLNDSEMRKSMATKERRKTFCRQSSCPGEQIERFAGRMKPKHVRSVDVEFRDSEIENLRSRDRSEKVVENGLGKVKAQTENEHHENVEEDNGIPMGMATLKLKGKNQQLMEKKSVFTIAYDDATTEHLEASSNGSVHE